MIKHVGIWAISRYISIFNSFIDGQLVTARPVSIAIDNTSGVIKVHTKKLKCSARSTYCVALQSVTLR